MTQNPLTHTLKIKWLKYATELCKTKKQQQQQKTTTSWLKKHRNSLQYYTKSNRYMKNTVTINIIMINV